MRIPYNHTENINLNQQLKDPEARHVDAHRVAVLLIPENPGKAVWDRLVYSDILKPRYKRQQRQVKDSKCLTSDLPNRNGTRILMQSIQAGSSTFDYLSLSLIHISEPTRPNAPSRMPSSA